MLIVIDVCHHHDVDDDDADNDHEHNQCFRYNKSGKSVMSYIYHDDHMLQLKHRHIVIVLITKIIIDIITNNNFTTITINFSDYSDGWADRPDVIKGLEEVAVGEQNNFLMMMMTVVSWTTNLKNAKRLWL